MQRPAQTPLLHRLAAISTALLVLAPAGSANTVQAAAGARERGALLAMMDDDKTTQGSKPAR